MLFKIPPKLFLNTVILIKYEFDIKLRTNYFK